MSPSEEVLGSKPPGDKPLVWDPSTRTWVPQPPHTPTGPTAKHGDGRPWKTAPLPGSRPPASAPSDHGPPRISQLWGQNYTLHFRNHSTNDLVLVDYWADWGDFTDYPPQVIKAGHEGHYSGTSNGAGLELNVKYEIEPGTSDGFQNTTVLLNYADNKFLDNGWYYDLEGPMSYKYDVNNPGFKLGDDLELHWSLHRVE